MHDSQSPELWLRKAGENARAYEAWRVYRDLGPRRTLRQVAENCGAGQRTVEGWSTRFGWTARCQAYAEYQEAESRHQQLEALAEMNRRHVAIAKTLQVKAVEKLNSVNGTTLTARETLSYLELAIKVERLANGSPTDVQERRTDSPMTPGRMSRAVLDKPEAMTKALDLLDLVAATPA